MKSDEKGRFKGGYREVLRSYLPMLNPHEYWAERQLGRLGRKTFKNVVTLQGKSKSIAFAMEKLCFYKVKPILLLHESTT